MSEEESIEVGAWTEGSIDLPILDVLAGRGFITGKSGSGKSNTASVVAEKLLDRGFSILVVDIEGEYYGLKEEYEILHAGADEECDIRVSEEHADKLASLALEQNVPIILDLSGFIEEGEAETLLTAVARRLFAKEKKVKQPFLMIVEEIHEYVPEGGGMDECGRMLIKVAKRGRKHGLGIAGISQRPADVKKDFITQCDWLVWHRLTWQNDTRVVKRVLGSDYADAVEDLDDGEGFLMTDWAEAVRRVQFHRKETFDAGATPGLEDFERPDLKSVSDDLVDELQSISEAEAEREAEISRLENELAEREQRIAELEEELAEARDLSRMAEQFARAMTEQAGGRPVPTDQASLPEYADDDGDDGDPRQAAARRTLETVSETQRAIIADAAAAHEDGTADGTGDAQPDGAIQDGTADGTGDAQPDGAIQAGTADDGGDAGAPGGDARADDGVAADGDVTIAGDVTVEGDLAAAADDGGDEQPSATGDSGVAATVENAEIAVAVEDAESAITVEDAGLAAAADAVETAVTPADSAAAVSGAVDGATPAESDSPPADDGAGDPEGVESPGPTALAEALRERVAALDDRQRGMLARYREVGTARPERVHEAAGGSGERVTAYRHNRALRKGGLVVHVGRGRYAYALPSLLEALCDGLVDDRRADLLATAEAPLDD